MASDETTIDSYMVYCSIVLFQSVLFLFQVQYFFKDCENKVSLEKKVATRNGDFVYGGTLWNYEGKSCILEVLMLDCLSQI